MCFFWVVEFVCRVRIVLFGGCFLVGVLGLMLFVEFFGRCLGDWFRGLGLSWVVEFFWFWVFCVE